MEIKLSHHGLKLSTTEKHYINSKFKHVLHFARALNDSSVKFSVEVHKMTPKGSPEMMQVKAHLTAPGKDMYVDESDPSFTEVVDSAASKLIHQTEKYKGKKTSKIREAKLEKAKIK